MAPGALSHEDESRTNAILLPTFFREKNFWGKGIALPWGSRMAFNSQFALNICSKHLSSNRPLTSFILTLNKKREGRVNWGECYQLFNFDSEGTAVAVFVSLNSISNKLMWSKIDRATENVDPFWTIKE